jgi:hypothetical protein
MFGRNYMKKKAVVALCSLMAVLSLAACGKGKETSPESEWAGVYIGKDGSLLILCEDGGGYINGGTPDNYKIKWKIDDDEIVIKCDRFEKLIIDIDDAEPDDTICVSGKEGQSWRDEDFDRTEIYEED